VDQALALLEQIDAPGPEAVIEDVPVRNLGAPALATLIAQVAAKREAVSGEKVPGECLVSAASNAVLIVAPQPRVAYWRELIQRLDQRERVESATYSPRSFGVKEVGRLIEETIKDQPGSPADDRWRLVADELTGTIIVTATPSQQEQVKALVARLDAAPAAAQRPVRSFVVKNRPVKDVQAVLEQMVLSGVIGAAPEEASRGTSSGVAPPPGTAPWPPANQPGTQQPPAALSAAPSPLASAATGGAKPRAGRGPDAFVSFTSDDGTNTLIAMGEPRALAQIESLLATLDVRQPQVMLEVLIVSLSESQSLDLGVELEKLTTAGDTQVRLSSLFGLGTRGSGGDRTVGDGSGFTGLILSPGDFSVVLRALQTINRGRSLSMPRLLASNNQQATLDSVLTQPYASTNASNTVTTTSYGGVQDAGTQVTLKPQIGAGDHLNLDYSVSLSAFVGAAASANLPPPRQQNKVQSAASLPDGYTVAVGGIELTSEGQSTSQVPGLGSIPILGEAFKDRSKNASRSRFYVFIRATVLRSETYEDLRYASDLSAQQAGIGDGFPVVEPLVLK
jgi:general secretion pathway protein D